MRLPILIVLLAVALGAALAPRAALAKRLVYGGPAAPSEVRSLRAAIAAAHARGRPLHIVFVHGIRAEGPGESGRFAVRLARELGAPQPSTPSRHDLDLGPWPSGASVSGGPQGRTPIWRSEEEWRRSRPFVERATIRSPAGEVVVDEVNYWPLLFPVKCRFLLVPEHDLSGNDADHLKLCREWLDPGELDRLLATRPRSGGGAKANAVLKHQIMNWGLSDAVMTLGPMHALLDETMDKAFSLALEGGPDGQEYVVVSESLGSFVVLDAYARGTPSVAAVLDRTADLWFLANQFALLDLARIQGLERTDGQARALAASQPPSPLEALARWGARPSAKSALPGPPRQIVAFSDPSDLLTYRVPALPGVAVLNAYDRNEGSLLGLFANPVKAHTGHVANDAVWKLLMR